MPEREHPVAKAGRFVRAAGLASLTVARELEKQAAASQSRPVTVGPPPPRTTDFLGRTVFTGFLVSLVAFALVVLRAETLIGPHTVKLVFRLLLAAILFAWGCQNSGRPRQRAVSAGGH